MMRLPPFRYIAARTLEEAVATKAKYGAQAMYVAGGTDLYPKMKRRQFEPQVLIGLRGIPELRALSNHGEDGGLTIGAGLTLTEVAEHPQIVQRYPAVARAAALVSSPQLRNAGTIGGNLCVDTRCTYYDQSYAWRRALGFCMKKDGDTCWVALSSPRCLAVSSSDCAPVVIALEGRVRLLGPEGERVVPAEALYRNDGMHYLEKSPDELLVDIRLPQREGWRAVYCKLRRRGTIDFPILGVAVALRTDVQGVCRGARIVLGAVASRPLPVPQAAETLIGHTITPELAQEAARIAFKAARPLDNTDMALSYRKKITLTYVQRAILQAASRHP